MSEIGSSVNSFNNIAQSILTSKTAPTTKQVEELANKAMDDGILSGAEVETLIAVGNKAAKNMDSVDGVQKFISSIKVKDPVDQKAVFEFKKGMNNQINANKTEKAVLEIQKNAEGLGSTISRKLSGVSETWANFVDRDTKTGDEKNVVKNAEEKKEKVLTVTNTRATQITEGVAKKGSCISDAMGMIKAQIDPKGTWSVPTTPQNIKSPDFLNNLRTQTGRDWQSMDASKIIPKVALSGMEGKAMVTDNNHAYQFIKANDNGTIKVKDASGQIKDLSPKHDNLTIFKPGKSTQIENSVARTDGNTQHYGNIQFTATYQREKGTEAGNIRQVFAFMSDPSMKDKFKEFATLTKGATSMSNTEGIKKLTDFLGALKPPIKLEKDELVAMSNALNAKLPPGSIIDNKLGKKQDASGKTMLDVFAWVNSGPKDALTPNQTRVLGGIEHSNVPLENYFSEKSKDGPQGTAKNMLDNVNLFLCNGGGC